MNMNRIMNHYISVDDEKYFILCDEGIKDKMVRVYEITAQDNIVFDRSYDSIRYVRIAPGYEYTFRSGDIIPIDYINKMSQPVHVLGKAFNELPKGIRNRVDIDEYIYANETYENWDNIICLLGYIQGCDNTTAKNLCDVVNEILLSDDAGTCKKLSQRLLLTDPYITMLICENIRFRKFLLKHIREYLFLKRHCDNLNISFFDLITAAFGK